MFRLQTVGGFGGKSDQLNAYNVFVNDPGYFGRDLQRYRDITRDSIQAALQRYIDRAPRVMLSVVPRGRADLGLPGATPAVVS